MGSAGALRGGPGCAGCGRSLGWAVVRGCCCTSLLYIAADPLLANRRLDLRS